MPDRFLFNACMIKYEAGNSCKDTEMCYLYIFLMPI